MKSNESTIIGLGCVVLGVLGMILLDHFVQGITHTVLASAVIVVLLTAALILHHGGHQMVLSARRDRLSSE